MAARGPVPNAHTSRVIKQEKMRAIDSANGGRRLEGGMPVAVCALVTVTNLCIPSLMLSRWERRVPVS